MKTIKHPAREQISERIKDYLKVSRIYDEVVTEEYQTYYAYEHFNKKGKSWEIPSRDTFLLGYVLSDLFMKGERK